MNLYIISRWGNPFDDDGPDGKDTNFLVRAGTMEDAARMVDEAYLQYTPKARDGERGVNAFAQCVAQIGVDPLSEEPMVMHQWIQNIIVTGSKYDTWHRRDQDGPWENVSEEHRQMDAERES